MRSAVGTKPLARERAFYQLSSTQLALGGMLLLALLVRLLFINADGFTNDVSSFEGWSMTLAQYPMREFFAKAGFADYPPGYFFVLWIVGHAYHRLIASDPGYGIIKIMVKLPAIAMDLVDSLLIFRIVRRHASLGWAFAAATLFAFNPATIFISAYWGQVDSVAGGLVLVSLMLMMDASDRTGRAVYWRVAAGWIVLACSILMKPPGVVLVPLYLAWIFASGDSAVRVARAAATWLGVAGGLLVSYLASFAFEPDANPVAVFAWLIRRYAYASSVYPYNSVNAFNLYVVGPWNKFWQSDTVPIPNISGFGLPMYGWGIALLVAATLLVVSRIVQRREAIALLEASAILSLGYFVLSTRMHERYSFNALMLLVPLIFYRRRYLYAAVVISFTLLANLFYSLDYLHVMSDKVAGVDPADLMPLLSRGCAFLNVVTFFYLGYVYLGSGEDVLERFDAPAALAGAGASIRRWYAPLAGTAAMAPVDWAIAGTMTVASFVLTFVDYKWPIEKIFDEIYYARAGEEYLTHKEIFEFTHPPLTKLWITLSMILFGGMHGGGDTSVGWRFLNLVMGALMVLVIYCFAKRLLGTTFFATVAASLLLFDGFHYVQSRIATPEITVAFFALLTLYAFYRFWLASQVRVAFAFSAKALPLHAAVLGVGLIGAGLFSWAIMLGQPFFLDAHLLAFAYAGLAAYLATRLIVPRFGRAAAVVSYPEGSRVTGSELRTLDAGIVPERGALLAGDATFIEDGRLVYAAEGVRIDYARDGSVQYATTGGGTAAFSPDGTVHAGAATIDGRRDGMLWLVLLSISAGCLGASKWNGLFDFFVVWLIAAGVVIQGIWRPLTRALGLPETSGAPATWGNPFGVSLDVLIGAMLFIGSTIYALCYIPYFKLGHNLHDLIGLQQQMFGYHYDLKATHPYGSKWWQWPFIGRPISYYYHDWRVGAATQIGSACCVAEILALPNPAVWWFGLLSIPIVAVLGIRERNKGYLLLAVAYFLQWLPWAASPRVAFEYHFFPNLAVICLADAIVLQRLWNWRVRGAAARIEPLGQIYVFGCVTLIATVMLCYSLYYQYQPLIGIAAGMVVGIVALLAGSTLLWRKLANLQQLTVSAYLVLVVCLFVFFYPILAGLHVTWNVWDARMWQPLMHNAWI